MEQYGSTHDSTGRQPPVNTGTLDSALNAVATRAQTEAQNRTLFPTPMPKQKFKMPSRFVIKGIDFTHFLSIAKDGITINKIRVNKLRTNIRILYADFYCTVTSAGIYGKTITMSA